MDIIGRSEAFSENRFQVSAQPPVKKTLGQIEKETITRVKILPVGEKEALVSGDILADLRKTGQSIGLEDVLIAASALTNQCTMVTANTRHF